MGLRIGGRVGPVSASTRVRGKDAKGCLTLILGLLLLAGAWWALTWPYRLGGWAAEGPYLAVVILGGAGGLYWLSRRGKRRRM